MQGIIKKKSAYGSRTLPLIIFAKKVPFFPKQCYFKAFPGETTPKVPGRCPNILDYTLDSRIHLILQIGSKDAILNDLKCAEKILVIKEQTTFCLYGTQNQF